jgi:hypothetical protein
MRGIALLSLLALTMFVAQVPAADAAIAAPAQVVKQDAAKQPVVTGFYRGESISYYDFGPIKLRSGNKLAPIWSVTNGAADQRNVVDTLPGQNNYSPLWRVNTVTWKTGVKPRILQSAAQVHRAEAVGDVSVKQTATVVNCPVLGFGQKRITGFSNGHPIHYYDDGPIKAAPGNDTAPLYAPMNGVAGQHNIALENIAPGQTRYPALWTIIAVTWKQSAHKSLLTSAAQIKKAEAAGLLTTAPTTLVVNCPVIA